MDKVTMSVQEMSLRMKQSQLDRYSVDNIIQYKTAVSAVDSLVKQGLLSQKDRAEMYAILGKKYGISLYSIFAA